MAHSRCVQDAQVSTVPTPAVKWQTVEMSSRYANFLRCEDDVVVMWENVLTLRRRMLKYLEVARAPHHYMFGPQEQSICKPAWQNVDR